MADAAGGDDEADLLLWARASAGDADAFGELFDRNARAVYNFCFRMTADWSAAEDLTSAAFVQAWRRAGSVRLEDAVLPWLLAVARNVCLNHRRSARRRSAALARVSVAVASPDHADDVAGRLDDERQMRAVHDALAGLRGDDRAVVDLVLLGGLPYAEAALALGVPVGTVRSRLSRAKGRLKDAALAARLDEAAEPAAPVGHRRGEGAAAPGSRRHDAVTLPGDRDLPPGSHARLRRTVMDETCSASGPVPSRRRRNVVVGGSLAALLVGGGTVAATAGGLAVWRFESGVVGIDQNRLDPYYKGRVITQAELERLQEQGQAKYPVSAPEYACKGYLPYFYTEAEADADFKAYAERTRARGTPSPGQVGPGATGDPCDRFTDPSSDASPER